MSVLILQKILLVHDLQKSRNRSFCGAELGRAGRGRLRGELSLLLTPGCDSTYEGWSQCDPEIRCVAATT